MAIEFNCPYCTALIRVPDNAGGGKGRCPKCTTRISVPKVSPPKLVAPSPVALPPVAEPDRPREIENFFDPDYDPAQAAPSAPLDIFAAPQRPPGEFPVTSSHQPAFPSSVAARLKKKKRGGAWLWPLAFGLLVCGAAGWYFWQQFQTELLGGELVAETADTLELPPGLIEKSSIRRSSDDVEEVLSKLEKSPVPLLSTLMQVQLRGSSKGVLVHLNAGPKSRFYRIAVRDNEPLMKYHSKHAAELEEQRMHDIEQAGTAFVVEYRKVITKEADALTIAGFRNSLALPALTRGLGHQLVATYGRTIYPCVYEDHEGALYFLLPPDAREFEISGRKHADGSIGFPATYKVKVAGELKAPAKKNDEIPAEKSKDKKNPATKPGDEPKEKVDTMDEAAE
jgi:hypothetical protein